MWILWKSGRYWYSGCSLASDDNETINLIQKTKPDVVLLDIIMPNLDGLGILEHINKFPLV